VRKKLVAALLTGVVASVGPLVSVLPAAAEQPVFSVPYSDNLYVLSEGDVALLDYAEWSALGFPTPTPAHTEYGVYPWSPVIYAVSPFADAGLVNALTYDEWARAGLPSPTVVINIPGTTVVQWASSNELFSTNIQGGDVHKLTFAEWGQLGYLAPEVLAQQGFYQLSWVDAPGIAFQDLSGAGEAVAVTFEEWQAVSYPTPAKVNRIFGDTFTLDANGDIYYNGPTLADYKLSFEEWQAAGFPEPTAAPVS
jgi:hypothetical protein